MEDSKEYKIGDIARIAGVSKRTIDYYTTRGLLKPFRSDSNYRYYSGESVVRLQLIGEMKKRRLTLEEIKDRFDLMEIDCSDHNETENAKLPFSMDSLTERFRQLQLQLLSIQPIISNSDQIDVGQAPAMSREFLVESMFFIQELMALIRELSHFI